MEHCPPLAKYGCHGTKSMGTEPWHMAAAVAAASLGLIPYNKAQVGLTQSGTMGLAKNLPAKGILAGRLNLLPSLLSRQLETTDSVQAPTRLASHPMTIHLCPSFAPGTW